jgi:hypothetical protein
MPGPGGIGRMDGPSNYATEDVEPWSDSDKTFPILFPHEQRSYTIHSSRSLVKQTLGRIKTPQPPDTVSTWAVHCPGPMRTSRVSEFECINSGSTLQGTELHTIDTCNSNFCSAGHEHGVNLHGMD